MKKERNGFYKFMKRKDLRQREVAEALGVTTGVVAHYAIGSSYPLYKNILKLIELGITADELFGKEYADKLLKNTEQERNPKDEALASLITKTVSEVLGARSKTK